ANSGAYVMSDRGTWLSFKNRGDLVLAVEGDKLLFNQYGVILVNPARHPHVKKELGQQFIDWLISDEGQKAIADYKVNGEQLFCPHAEYPERVMVPRIDAASTGGKDARGAEGKAVILLTYHGSNTRIAQDVS